MSPDTTSENNSVIDRFDKILFKHLERLIGCSHGIGGLPMNSATISCLILLMERENEIENFPSDPSIRYTLDTLINELRELGFSPDNDMNIVIQDMIEKGYINMGDNDQFVPEKPASSMAKLLDRAFPGMPGMNLAGYFIQMMDEVKSERKDLDSAISQYDQTLFLQGVPLIKRKADSEMSKGSKQSRELEAQIVKPDIFGQQKDGWRRDEIRVTPSEPKILSSAVYKGKVRKIDFGKTFIEEDQTDKITLHSNNNIVDETQTVRKDPEEKKPFGAEPESFNTEFVTSSNQLIAANLNGQSPSVSATFTKVSMDDLAFSVPASSWAHASSEQDKSSLDNNKDDSSKVAPASNHHKNKKETAEIVFEAGNENKESEFVDDEISHLISAFEDGLAKECPICRHSKVQAEKTTMGKTYYKCSNKNCSFISWGKPFHILCPQCNNPFLVEATKAGKTILKCPRATCRYWKKASWDIIDNQQETIDSTSKKTDKVTSVYQKPRKRVVRRRVVRKKR